MSTTHPGRTGSGVGEVPFSEDAVFDFLCNERRRNAIRLLLSKGKTSLERMVDFVAKRECGGSDNSHGREKNTVYESLSPPSDDPARKETWRKERKSVYVSLRQHHLPLLDENEIVEFDPDSGVVRSTQYTEYFRRVLTPVAEDETTGTDPPSTGGSTDETDSIAAFEPSNTEQRTLSRSRMTYAYVLLCTISWTVAIVDGLNLLAYEFITSGEWTVLLLLNLTALVVVQMYSEHRPDEKIPLIP